MLERNYENDFKYDWVTKNETTEKEQKQTKDKDINKKDAKQISKLDFLTILVINIESSQKKDEDKSYFIT